MPSVAAVSRTSLRVMRTSSRKGTEGRFVGNGPKPSVHLHKRGVQGKQPRRAKRGGSGCFTPCSVPARRRRGGTEARSAEGSEPSFGGLLVGDPPRPVGHHVDAGDEVVPLLGLSQVLAHGLGRRGREQQLVDGGQVLPDLADQ